MKFLLSRPVLWGFYRLANETTAKWIMKLAVSQKDKMNSDTIAEYYKVFRRDKQEKTSIKLFNGIRSDINRLVSDKFSELKCPTLVLWAEKDFLLPVSIAEGIHSEIKNSKLKILPNCGHFSQEEEPELIAGHIRDFINQSAPDSTISARTGNRHFLPFECSSRT